MPLFFWALLLLIFAAPDCRALSKVSLEGELVEVGGDLAQVVYLRLPDEPDPYGEGVVVKDGAIACWESGSNAAFAYSCDCGEEGVERLGNTQASELYHKLPERSQSNDGEGGRIRHADLQCFQKGVRAPFGFSCLLR